MSITRRHLVKVLGSTGAVLSSAGCLGLNEAASNETLTNTDSQTETPDPQTGTPGPDPQPPPARDLFDGVPCPSFADADRTVCWHTRANDEVAIKPSQVVFQPVSGNDEVETIKFTLTNTRNAPITFNPYSWGLKRQTESSWTHVAPESVAYEPLYELDPGTTYQWVLSRHQHPTPKTTRTVYPTVAVDNGRYAFVLTGSLLGSSPNTTQTDEGMAGTTIEWVTLFEVQRIYR